MIDKYKSCKGCPDRCADPNCHETCEGYIHRQGIRAEQNEERHRGGAYFEFKADVVESTKRRYRNGMLRARKKYDRQKRD